MTKTGISHRKFCNTKLATIFLAVAAISASPFAFAQTTDLDINAVNTKTITLWDKPILYYGVDDSLPPEMLGVIIEGADMWSDLSTNYSFVFAEGGGDINFKAAERGCAAEKVGKPAKGPAVIKLSPTCDAISVAHEIGHVLGFEHEFQRLDRDKFININNASFDYIKSTYSDIYPRFIKNFQRADITLRVAKDGVKPIELNISAVELEKLFPFQYQSIMMYASYPRNNEAIADDLKKHNLPLFTDAAKNEISRPDGLSKIDKDRVNFYYCLGSFASDKFGDLEACKKDISTTE